MGKQYVQHISGQGEKWEVAMQSSKRWIVKPLDTDYMDTLDLPKSEYRLCEPPERWVDVTAECEPLCWGIGHKSGEGNSYTDVASRLGKNYRLRKVAPYEVKPQWAFIIEKREA